MRAEIKTFFIPVSVLALFASMAFPTMGYAADSEDTVPDTAPPLTAASFESQIRDQIEEGKISIKEKPLTALGLQTIGNFLGYKENPSLLDEQHQEKKNVHTSFPQVTSVTLTQCDLKNQVPQTAVLLTILAVTQKSQDRISLDLRDNDLTAKDLLELFSGRTSLQQAGSGARVFPFSTIDFSENPLGDDTTFDPETSHNLLYRMGGDHLISLRLSNCGLGDKAANSIAQSLSKWERQKLNLLLDLSHNQITEKGVTAILRELKALQKEGKSLHMTFDLSENSSLTDTIAQLILQALEDEEITRTVHFVLPSTISADLTARFRALHPSE